MTVLRRSPDAVEMAVNDTLVVVDPAGKQELTLNSVAALIWAALAEPTDVGGLVEICAAEFSDVDRERIRRDVTAFVDEAARLGVITEA